MFSHLVCDASFNIHHEENYVRSPDGLKSTVDHEKLVTVVNLSPTNIQPEPRSIPKPRGPHHTIVRRSTAKDGHVGAVESEQTILSASLDPFRTPPPPPPPKKRNQRRVRQGSTIGKPGHPGETYPGKTYQPVKLSLCFPARNTTVYPSYE